MFTANVSRVLSIDPYMENDMYKSYYEIRHNAQG